MKTVAIIEPCSSGVTLVKKSHALGYRTIVLTSNAGQRVESRPVWDYADRIVEVDTNQDAAVCSVIRKLQRSESIQAVMPGGEYHVPLAAEIAHALGCPGLPIEHVAKVRLKDTMRLALQSHHLACPRFAIVQDAGTLCQAAEAVGFPAVLKPVNMSGSLMVQRVDTMPELQAVFADFSHRSVTDLDLSPSGRFVLEQYLTGNEYSVEGYVVGDNVEVVSITEKLLGPEPLFVEMGHIVQADLKQETRAVISDYVTDVVNAFHISLGPFHAEVRMYQGRCILIEIAARLAGDHICDLIELAHGVDLYSIMLRSFAGDALPEIRQHTNRVAGIIYFCQPDIQQYHQIDGRSTLKDIPGFVQFHTLIGPDQCLPPVQYSEDRLAYAIFVADTYQQVRAAFQAAREAIRFVP